MAKSYVYEAMKGNEDGRLDENGIDILVDGVQDYSQKMVDAITPLSEADVPIVVTALKTIIQDLETMYPESKKFSGELQKLFKHDATLISKAEDLDLKEEN